MCKKVTDYYKELDSLIKAIKVTDNLGWEISLDDAGVKVIEMIFNLPQAHNKLIFIGNGASAAIASHQAVDFWKNGGIRAAAFNDPALLTCISNDCGYQDVFVKPIEMFADSGDILFAISSSGRSVNIINAVKAAVKKDCRVVTLSGFKEDNSLRSLGDLNFYVPVSEYSYVEVIHHSICHFILEMIIEHKKSRIKNV
ncbi:MAG: SIS domain-containing protein [Candidatus Omnitrophota bacterium]